MNKVNYSPKFSLQQEVIYNELKKAGPDGNTSLLALLKMVLPSGTFRAIANISRAIIYMSISRIKKKIRPIGEEIRKTGSTQRQNNGYLLKKIDR